VFAGGEGGIKDCRDCSKVGLINRLCHGGVSFGGIEGSQAAWGKGSDGRQPAAKVRDVAVLAPGSRFGFLFDRLMFL